MEEVFKKQLSRILNLLDYFAQNVRRNTTHIFDDMTLRNWIRIVAVVGAYLLLRPYLLGMGKKIQAKEHEKKTPAPKSCSEETASKKIASGSRRKQGTASTNKDMEGYAPRSAWRQKAKIDQSTDVGRILDIEERLLLAEQGDDQITDLLVDYDEDEWARSGTNTTA